MTEVEVNKLRGGEKVLCRMAGKWRVSTVTEVCRYLEREDGEVYWIGVRRDGLAPNGKTYPVRGRKPHNLKLIAALDPQPANVYADFLDDAGEHKAAALLREAFPISAEVTP